jgi:hypothetical protein
MALKPYTKAELMKHIANGEKRLGLHLFYTPIQVEPILKIEIAAAAVIPAVVETSTVHSEDCRCIDVCLNARLDALLASSQKSLADYKKSLGQAEEVVVEQVTIVDENPYTEPLEQALVHVSNIKTYKGSNR